MEESSRTVSMDVPSLIGDPLVRRFFTLSSAWPTVGDFLLN